MAEHEKAAGPHLSHPEAPHLETLRTACGSPKPSFLGGSGVEVGFLDEMSRKKKTQSMPPSRSPNSISPHSHAYHVITFSFLSLLVFEENFPGLAMVRSLPEGVCGQPAQAGLPLFLDVFTVFLWPPHSISELLWSARGCPSSTKTSGREVFLLNT